LSPLEQQPPLIIIPNILNIINHLSQYRCSSLSSNLFKMQFSITMLSVFALAIFASAAPTLTISQRQDEQMQYIANLANQLNEDIVHTTQFFEAFPTLSGLALTTQASAAETALLGTTGVIGTIAMELSNNAMAQVIKAGLLNNDFLLDISLQLQDFAQGINLDILARNFSSILLINEYR
jgi:hypothetical protein